MKDKVLITGATGFVGACLTENLVREDYQVNIVARENSNTWRLNKIINDVNVINAELSNEDQVIKIVNNIKPEIIFHLATYGGYAFQQDKEKVINTNFIGTVNLINACCNIDFNAFINVGSSSEYGVKSVSMKETDLLEPINTYGVSKSAATLYCQMLAKTQKKPIATVRLFSPYGYYEDKTRLIPSVILACLNNENPKLASGDAVRDFIFIEDAIELLKKVSRYSNISGKIYNAGSGTQHSVKKMVNTIISISNSNAKPEWGCVEGRKSDIASKWEADMSFVKDELDWMPKFSLARGVEKTIQWFKENIKLY